MSVNCYDVLFRVNLSDWDSKQFPNNTAWHNQSISFCFTSAHLMTKWSEHVSRLRHSFHYTNILHQFEVGFTDRLWGVLPGDPDLDIIYCNNVWHSEPKKEKDKIISIYQSLPILPFYLFYLIAIIMFVFVPEAVMQLLVVQLLKNYDSITLPCYWTK